MLTLKTAWADGTRHLVFEPLTRPEKLAALTPRPRIARVVSYGAPPGEAPVAASVSANVNADPAALTPRHWAWVYLMRRAFDIDGWPAHNAAGACARSPLFEDPDAIRAILAALATSARVCELVVPSRVPRQAR